MAPGDVAHVPRTPSPVAEAGPVAKHFRSRARLRRLLAGLRPSTLHRSLPRTPSPVAKAGPVAKHFRSRARLRRLLAGLRPSTPSTPALRATPGGASLTTFGFVTIVPRYLLEASNFLTFVRGACRAYRAPRKWLWRPTFALHKLAAARPRRAWSAYPAAAPCRHLAARRLAARKLFHFFLSSY